MARVEYPKKETDVKKGRKGRAARILSFFYKSFLGKLVIFLLIISLLLASWAAYLGMIEIPFLSWLFYRSPEPTRHITIASGSENSIGERIGEKLVADLNYPKVAIQITEIELTQLLKKATANNSEIPVRNVQTVIMTEGIELFGELITESRTYRTTILVKPLVSNGEIGFKVIKSKLENLSLPSVLANLLIAKMLDASLERLNNEINNYLMINSLQTENRNVRIQGTVINPNIPF